jgi:acyl-coenzyme A thioesterase PaaI-like protein
MRLKFAKLAEGKVGGHFVAHQHLQGYRGIIHGGVICSLLDSVMTNCLFLHGIEALTGEMTIKFLHSVPCNAQVELTARIEKAFEPLYLVTGELHSNNRLMATASAKFMKKNK